VQPAQDIERMIAPPGELAVNDLTRVRCDEMLFVNAVGTAAAAPFSWCWLIVCL
jgi:hypothetical protein